MKPIKTISIRDEFTKVTKTASVGHRHEEAEYTVKFYLGSVYQQNADYFTDDKEDAIGTALHWCKL